MKIFIEEKHHYEPPQSQFTSKDGEANTCDCFEGMVHKGIYAKGFLDLESSSGMAFALNQ